MAKQKIGITGVTRMFPPPCKCGSKIWKKGEEVIETPSSLGVRVVSANYQCVRCDRPGLMWATPAGVAFVFPNVWDSNEWATSVIRYFLELSGAWRETMWCAVELRAQMVGKLRTETMKEMGIPETNSHPFASRERRHRWDKVRHRLETSQGYIYPEGIEIPPLAPTPPVTLRAFRLVRQEVGRPIWKEVTSAAVIKQV